MELWLYECRRINWPWDWSFQFSYGRRLRLLQHSWSLFSFFSFCDCFIQLCPSPHYDCLHIVFCILFFAYCFFVFVSHSRLSHSLCIRSHLACTVTHFLYYEHCLCKTDECSGCFSFFLFAIFLVVFLFVLFFVLTLLDGTCLHNQWSCRWGGNFWRTRFLGTQCCCVVHVAGMLWLQAGSNNTGQLLSTELGTSVSKFIAITKGNMGSRTTDGLSCRLMKAGLLFVSLMLLILLPQSQAINNRRIKSRSTRQCGPSARVALQAGRV